MGEKCVYQLYNLSTDLQYISLGNNVVVASDEQFICHGAKRLRIFEKKKNK